MSSLYGAVHLVTTTFVHKISALKITQIIIPLVEMVISIVGTKLLDCLSKYSKLRELFFRGVTNFAIMNMYAKQGFCTRQWSLHTKLDMLVDRGHVMHLWIRVPNNMGIILTFYQNLCGITMVGLIVVVFGMPCEISRVFIVQEN